MSPGNLRLDRAREAKTKAVAVQVQGTDKATRDTLVPPADAVACDNLSCDVHKVRREAGERDGREDLGPVSLLYGHGCEEQVRSDDGDDANSHDVLCGYARDEPGGEADRGYRADTKWDEVDADGNEIEVAEGLLPGDGVPHANANPHVGEERDKDERCESRRAKDVEGHDRVNGEFLLPEEEEAEHHYGKDEAGYFVGSVPTCGGCLAVQGEFRLETVVQG